MLVSVQKKRGTNPNKPTKMAETNTAMAQIVIFSLHACFAAGPDRQMRKLGTKKVHANANEAQNLDAHEALCSMPVRSGRGSAYAFFTSLPLLFDLRPFFLRTGGADLATLLQLMMVTIVCLECIVSCTRRRIVVVMDVTHAQSRLSVELAYWRSSQNGH